MVNKELRVLQIIDSFDIGGAERISITFANSLSEKNISSYICATRKGGLLEETIDTKVKKIILNKKSTFDIIAILKLAKFIKINKINILHAHSSSYFIAVLLKLICRVKLVWHDHNGFRYKTNKNHNNFIKFFSNFFDDVIVVNEELKKWSMQNLHLNDNKIYYLENFAQLLSSNKKLNLPGKKNNRIVSLANFRWQKDHMNLLNAFNVVFKSFPELHLFLVGENKNDKYSNDIESFIKKNNLEKNIHILGSRIDSADILLHSSIGVISSKTEGLPVSLLEYGLANLAVISTDVGQCSKVLGMGNYGKVIPPQDSKLLAMALKEFILDKKQKELMASKFFNHVSKKYSKNIIIDKLIHIYKDVISEN